jgi:hypothetical protein
LSRPQFRAFVACATCAWACVAPAEAAADRFRLVISGSTFVDFEGDCRLVDERGFEVWAQLAGSVPQTYAISAEAVACEVEKSDLSGTLTVRLEQNGATVARASTRTSLGEVSVRSAGPWGPARATVKVVPIFPRHGIPRSRQPGLPPLNPPIVPPLSGQSVPPLR